MLMRNGIMPWNAPQDHTRVVFEDAEGRIWEIFEGTNGKCSGVYLNFKLSRNIDTVPQEIFETLKNQLHRWRNTPPDIARVTRLIQQYVPVSWEDSNGNIWKFLRTGLEAEKWRVELNALPQESEDKFLPLLDQLAGRTFGNKDIGSWDEAKEFIESYFTAQKKEELARTPSVTSAS